MEQKTILVIGSNSFSGSNFVNSLLSKGDRVVGISRSSEVVPEFSGYSKNENIGNFSFQKLDMNFHIKEIVDLAVVERVSTIVNFSAQSMVAQSWLTPEDWYETNVVALAKFTRELSRLKTLERFINFSTPEVYGTTEDWIGENFNFHPTTPYAISRAAADFHLKTLAETFGFPVIFTRAANVYGPGQQLYRVVPRAILAGLLGRKIPLQGGGTSIRSFIHIDDVSRALISIIEAGRLGESYHISTNELITIYELMEVIALQMGIDVLEMVEIAPERPGKDFAYKLSSEKLRSQLGWSDTVTLRDGIAGTIQWATENLDSLRETTTEYRHQR